MDVCCTYGDYVWCARYASEHDLSNLIDAHYATHRKSPFSQANVKTLVQHLLLAVEYMHQQHLIHRDIKLSNLLYTEHGMLKLADFGLSRPYSHAMSSSSSSSSCCLTPQVASLWYRPPELLLGGTTYTTSLDLWAVGCIFGELLTGQPLMKGTSEIDQIQQIFDCLGYPSPELLQQSMYGKLSWIPNVHRKSRRTILVLLGDVLSQSGLELVTCGLLQYDPNLRWTATKALQSRYFQDESPQPTQPKDMPHFPRSFQT